MRRDLHGHRRGGGAPPPGRRIERGIPPPKAKSRAPVPALPPLQRPRQDEQPAPVPVDAGNPDEAEACSADPRESSGQQPAAGEQVAVAAGEMPALRGFPPSTANQIMRLAERAGPGLAGSGDITAIFSVLVAGSDMEEPIADILRGVLDGHVVLSREIAERGRFPAIDVLRSVSRSLPEAATEEENDVLLQARHLLGAYARSETMIRAGLYREGEDPLLDQAIRAWPDLDTFFSEAAPHGPHAAFNQLRLILRRSGVRPPQQRRRLSGAG